MTLCKSIDLSEIPFPNHELAELLGQRLQRSRGEVRSCYQRLLQDPAPLLRGQERVSGPDRRLSSSELGMNNSQSSRDGGGRCVAGSVPQFSILSLFPIGRHNHTGHFYPGSSENSGKSNVFVSPAMVARVVIGVVVAISCITITLGSM